MKDTRTCNRQTRGDQIMQSASKINPACALNLRAPVLQLHKL
jgi:hypothetical protein